MKSGADGSLRRITSSVDSNSILILPSSESQNPLIPAYRLFVIGEDKNRCETTSEKSEDDIDDKIVKDVNLNIENDTKNDSDGSRKSNINMDRKNESSHRHRNQNRPQSNNWRSKGRRKRIRNSRAGRRNYNNSNNAFQQSTNTEIRPWLNPRDRMIHENISFSQYNDYSTFSQPTVMIPAISPNPSDASMKFGLLGDSPLCHPISSQFHHANPVAIPDPMFWNNKLVAEPNAVPNQSYYDNISNQNIISDGRSWNDERENNYGPSNSYQRPVLPDRKHPREATHRNRFHHNGYRNKRENNNGRDRWQGNPRNDQECRKYEWRQMDY